MRTPAQVRAAAVATGTFSGPFLHYQGDGYSVPWQVATEVGLLGVGLTMGAFKLYLDTSHPEYARLHDWCYTPYATLANPPITRAEADLTLGAELGAADPVSGAVVYASVAAFGGLYFGHNKIGWAGWPPGTNRVDPFGGNGNIPDPKPPARAPTGVNPMPTKCVILMQATTAPTGASAPSLGHAPVERTTGWSEYWWSNNAPAGALVELLGPRAQGRRPLLSARAGILSSNASIIGVRLYEEDGRGSLLNVRFKGSAGTTDIPKVGILCKAASTTGQVRSWIVRGIPDDWVKGGEFAPDQSVVSRFLAYFEGVRGFGFGHTARANEVDLFSIDPVAGTTDGSAVVTTKTGHFFIVGDKVRISRAYEPVCERFRGGNFRVTALIDADSFAIKKWPETKPTINGSAWKKAFGQVWIGAESVLTATTATTQETGRPFAAFVGRR